MNRVNKLFIKLLFYFGFIVLTIVNITQAQICSGTWITNDPFNFQCIITGQLVGRFNAQPFPDCPINPSYNPSQTNTYTFDNPVSDFTIDFNAFSGPDCARIEVRINGVFYHLTNANFIDYPLGSTCTGSFNLMAVTPDGYLTGIPNIGVMLNGQGRIIFNSVNATNVTVSTNDGAGSVFSTPYNCLAVIPLKLKSFTGMGINNCKAILKCETGVESNIKSIEIQRSENSSKFLKVAEVIPTGSYSMYSVEIANSSDGYFRLKVNDLDGYYEYSEIIHIKSSCNNDNYSIFPNPTSGEIKISGLKKNDQVIVSDMLGKIIMKFNSLQSNKLNLILLPSGTYIFQIFNAGICKVNLKLMKA